MDQVLTITRAEFDHLKALQLKKRWDWPAVFSVNNRCDIWPFVTRGWTPEQEREPVRGLSRVVDEVAERYLSERCDGGRFFVDDLHAFWKCEIDDSRHVIVIFRIV
jgi:hypothetical protein